MLNRLVGFVCLCVVASLSFGEPFTYQGELNSSGSPADGMFEMAFTLRSTANSSMVAGPITQVVQVQDGLFSTDLEFGGGVFEGEKLSLQIEIRPDGDPGMFTELLPWIEIHSAPTSQYSHATRGIFVNNQHNIGIGTTNANNAKLVVEPDGEVVTALFAGEVRVGDVGLGLSGNMLIDSLNAPVALIAINNGTAVRGTNNSLNSNLPSVWGDTDSTERSAVAVRGTINSTTSGAESAGVHGTNNGLGNTGYGVWGSHAGGGVGIYGTSASGYAGLFAGTVQVNDDLRVRNEILKDYGTNEYLRAVPVAFGSFSSGGAKLSGTANLSGTLNQMTYNLTIAGETYNNNEYSVAITPIFFVNPMPFSDSAPIFGTPSAGSGGVLALRFVELDVSDSATFGSTVLPTLASFHVIVYKNTP